MEINKLNESKVPIIKLDRELEKLQGKVLFQEKLDVANEILSNSKLPDDIVSQEELKK